MERQKAKENKCHKISSNVNFTKILQAVFADILLQKNYRAKLLLEKSCSKHLRKKVAC